MREKEKKVVRDEYIEGTHNHARVCLVHLCLPPPQKKMRNPSNGMCVCVCKSFFSLVKFCKKEGYTRTGVRAKALVTDTTWEK